MTTLHITVGDREQLHEDTQQFVVDVGEGIAGEGDGRLIHQFGTYDDLVGNLTPLRLELIQASAKQNPTSMREAARLVDRDVSDVHSDLKQLEVLGVLSLKEGGPGGAMQPVVPFDRIEMHIDYPLLEDRDDDVPVTREHSLTTHCGCERFGLARSHSSQNALIRSSRRVSTVSSTSRHSSGYSASSPGVGATGGG